MRTTVYIAAPYGDATPEGRARNTARAVWLATVAHRMGFAPVCVYPLIELGVFGDDSDPEARASGLASAVALAASCQAIWAVAADYTGQRINLTLAPRFTAGVDAEVEAWSSAHQDWPVHYGMSWPQWRAYAEKWADMARMEVPPWPG